MNANSTYLELSKIENLSSFINPEKLQILMSSYLEDSQNILNKLAAVIADNNVQETTRLVHSLKSTSANVGALKFSELARHLEELARAQRLDEVQTQLDELIVLFAYTRTSIEQLDFMKN
ncbi:MAG: Hpt domain-containing protein [Thioalkalispiraceae bacterium]|jgi:HPt (histidine-containing phosphotransfer) domain-containing protein